MKRKFRPMAVAAWSMVGTVIVVAVAQMVDFSGPGRGERARRERAERGPGLRPRNFAGRGFGSGGGGAQRDLAIRKQFDKDGNKILDADERKGAREFLEKERAE